MNKLCIFDCAKITYRVQQPLTCSRRPCDALHQWRQEAGRAAKESGRRGKTEGGEERGGIGWEKWEGRQGRRKREGKGGREGRKTAILTKYWTVCSTRRKSRRCPGKSKSPFSYRACWPGEWLWVDSNCTDGKPTFHGHANLSSFSKICNHFREIMA